MKMKTVYFYLLGIINCLFSLQLNAQTPELWGMTYSGGNGFGTIFKLDTNGANYAVKYNFNENPGANPAYSKLCLANDGKLYGLTKKGGLNDFGVLFEYDTLSKIYTKIYDFNDNEGKYPYGNVIQASNNKLYGMTREGGLYDYGVLFEYDITNTTYTKLMDFDIIAGGYPTGDLLEINGKLYGMTVSGGSNGGYGVIFQYDIQSTIYTMKYSFDLINGGWPYGNLMQASNGKLYGLASDGGANNFGVLFEFDLITNAYTKKFDLDTINGINPRSNA